MPDQLQNELVRRAMARDAGQSIGALDPQTRSTPVPRDDPFSSSDLMHSTLASVADPTNFGGGPSAAGMAWGPSKGIVQGVMEQLPKAGISDLMATQLAPKPWYYGITAQPQPGTSLYGVLEKLGEISGAGGQLHPTEQALLKHFASLIR